MLDRLPSPSRVGLTLLIYALMLAGGWLAIDVFQNSAGTKAARPIPAGHADVLRKSEATHRQARAASGFLSAQELALSVRRALDHGPSPEEFIQLSASLRSSAQKFPSFWAQKLKDNEIITAFGVELIDGLMASEAAEPIRLVFAAMANNPHREYHLRVLAEALARYPKAAIPSDSVELLGLSDRAYAGFVEDLSVARLVQSLDTTGDWKQIVDFAGSIRSPSEARAVAELLSKDPQSLRHFSSFDEQLFSEATLGPALLSWGISAPSEAMNWLQNRSKQWQAAWIEESLGQMTPEMCNLCLTQLATDGDLRKSGTIAALLPKALLYDPTAVISFLETATPAELRDLKWDNLFSGAGHKQISSLVRGLGSHLEEPQALSAATARLAEILPNIEEAMEWIETNFLHNGSEATSALLKHLIEQEPGGLAELHSRGASRSPRRNLQVSQANLRHRTGRLAWTGPTICLPMKDQSYGRSCSRALTPATEG